MVKPTPFGNLCRTWRMGIWKQQLYGCIQTLNNVDHVKGMMKFNLSLKREKGECDLEQKISVLCKYPEHIPEGHMWRKCMKRDIYRSWMELDRWKQTKFRGFFYSFESSNFLKRGSMSMPIQKYSATEQELDTSPRRLYPINNFSFRLRLFNWK